MGTYYCLATCKVQLLLWNGSMYEGLEQVRNFPHCVGAINGNMYLCKPLHILGPLQLQRPTWCNAICLCDTHNCFTLVDIGDAGRHSDGGVLSNSAIGQALEVWELLLPSAEI